MVNDSPRSVTVVVPTYHEVLAIPHLISRLKSVREQSGLNLDVLLMDDDSGDGSAELVAGMTLEWVRLVTRCAQRGLSAAVLDGLRLSRGDYLVVMDADLSHPPEKIGELIDALLRGADIAVGSRFTDGGSTADDWGFLRWLNSRVATWLAAPLVQLDDPMSGYFAMRRATFERGRDFDPIGYKILLEIIIRCRCQSIAEVPIHFDNRRYGASKLSLREQFNYIRHLRRLYISKFGIWSHLVQFLVVGFSGLIVNLLILTLLVHFGQSEKIAVAVAIGVSMCWNFALNRRFSFSYARDQRLVPQFLGFVAACSVSAVVNFIVTTQLWNAVSTKQAAAALGVLVGTAFNFAASRFLVFRSRHMRP